MALRKAPVAPLAAALLVIVLSLGLAGCGNEPPAPGQLTVTSTPPGADILLEGRPTGEVTPHTFDDLDGGPYVVSVVRPDWTVFPGERAVEVPFGGRASAAFELSQQIGALTVESTPPGAAILLDGEDTGEVTPHTFASLIPGDYSVAVELANHAADPAVQTVTVTDGGEADASFSLVQLSVPRTLLLEGFSNVLCTGCPEFNATVYATQQLDGYGHDRMVYVKWPPPNPTPLDPFYFQTISLTDARVLYYDDDGGMNLPSAIGDGELLGAQGSPPGAESLRGWIDGQPATADVSVTVTTDEDLTDVTDLTHEVTVGVRAPAGLDLTGHELQVVLIYEEVETEEAYQGVTVFHGVMRDHVTVGDLGTLAPNQEVTVPVTLSDPDPTENQLTPLTPGGKQVVAWLQRASDGLVLQAGSTYPTAQPGGTR